MARLGRGRRSGAKITHARSVPTATPLVRKRLVLEMTPKHRLLRRLLHRQPRLARARSVPTATPLVRKRVVVEMVPKQRLARRFLHRQAIITRAPRFLPVVVRKRVVTELVPTNRLLRRLLHRQARIVRAPSTPTATPLVRKRLVLELQTVNRPRLARLRARKPKILQGAPGVLIATTRRFAVVRLDRRVPLAARARRRARVLRAPVFAQLLVKPIISRRGRAVTVSRARRRTRILRAPVFAPITLLRKPLVARRSRTALAARARRRRLIVVHSVVAAQPSRYRVNVHMRRRNRRTLRHATILRPRLTLAQTPTTFVTARYDHSEPGGILDHSTVAGGYDHSEPGGALDHLAPAGGFDRREPTGGIDR